MPLRKLTVGQSVWVYATIFDTPDYKWSEEQFGRLWASTRLVGEVRAQLQPNLWSIYFKYDDSLMDVDIKDVHKLSEKLVVSTGGLITESLSSGEESSQVSSESEHSARDEDEESTDDDEPLMPLPPNFRLLDPRVERDWALGDCTDAPPLERPYAVNPCLTRHMHASGGRNAIWWMFTQFFPVNYADEVIVTCTNITARAANDPEWVGDLDIGEFLVFLGIVCFMLVFKLGGDRRKYWKLTKTDAGVFPVPDLTRFMPCRRFELISKYLTLGDNDQLGDKLRYYRGWIDAVNIKFKTAVRPGLEIVVDESMIANKNDKADCRTYIPRKPSPWGHEFWTVVDCISGICIGFELNEGKEVTRLREFVAEFGATTATTLRLVSKYFNSNRIVYIDSWFQSVQTCEQLLANGLYSVGIVKTAHRNYPKNTLEAACGNGAGDRSCAYYITEVGHRVMAMQWRSSRHHKLTMLCSAYSAADVEDYVTSSGRRVRQPQAVKKWYNNFGGVDAFNHCRVGAGKDAWEYRLKPKNNPNFPLFTGLLSFIDANTFRALKHFCKDVFGSLSHTEFRVELTQVLLNNPLLKESNEERVRRQTEKAQVTHSLCKGKTRRRCVICSRVEKQEVWSYYYCSACGENKGHICSPTMEDRQCWEYHLLYGIPPRTRTTQGADE